MSKQNRFDLVRLSEVVLQARSGFASGERSTGGVIQLRMNNVSVEGGLDLTSPTRIPANQKQLKEFSLEEGDVLFNNTNSPQLVGKTAYFAHVDEPVLFSNHFTRLRFDQKRVFPKYAARWLTQMQQSRYFEARCRQWVNQAAFGTESLLELEMPVPPLEEQKRITAILDKSDTIRRKRQESLAASTHLITGAFRQMFGDCQANGREFPECEFQELCGKIVDCPHTTPTYADRLTEFACVRSSDIQDGYIDWGSTKYVEKDEYEVRIARHTPTAGEVLYTREGGRMGNAARVPENAKVCLGQRIMLFSEKGSETTNEFLWALLNSSGVRHQVKALTAGAAAPRINISDIRKLKVFFPPYELQERFSTVVGRIELLRQRQLAANKDETNLFNSLVQRAFKGEL